MKSLYVHFPFCESKCHYCDFYSLGRENTALTDPDCFEKALTQEALKAVPQLAQKLETLFFGGGTPSMTPPAVMSRALAPLQLQERLTSNTEWTMEANPSSVSVERFRDYRALGVNRISMGVQSTHDRLLKLLGRVHSEAQALCSLEALFEAGYQNVSVDLICGVPGQSLEDLGRSIETLTSFPITHLSCYLLTLPKTHPLAKAMPDEEEQLRHLLFLHDEMSHRGFEHYEISNFAKPGFRAQHNLAYWKGYSYLGLGPSAHSYDALQKRRWKNVSSLHRYAGALEKNESPMEWEEFLTPEQIRLEEWMLHLRLDEGFPKGWIQTPQQQKKVEIFQKEGFLEEHPSRPGFLRLTPRGFPLSDPIVAGLASSV